MGVVGRKTAHHGPEVRGAAAAPSIYFDTNYKGDSATSRPALLLNKGGERINLKSTGAQRNEATK